MVNKDLIEFLNSLDWNDIIKRLTAYCDWKIRAGKWWRRDTEELAKGFKPIDIVFEAINGLYTEDRNWNRERYPEVIDFLKSVIDSKISNLIYSYDHINQLIQERNDEEDDPGLDKYSGKTVDVLDEMVANELLNKIYGAIKDDEELEELLLLILGGSPPREIAKQLDTGVDDIYNRIKRLRRILIKIMNEEENE